MSKSAQRKNNIIADGRRHAVKGYPREPNPYVGAKYRLLWYQGWDLGRVDMFKNRRESKQSRRTKSNFLWRWWYRLLQAFGVV